MQGTGPFKNNQERSTDGRAQQRVSNAGNSDKARQANDGYNVTASPATVSAQSIHDYIGGQNSSDTSPDASKPSKAQGHHVL